MKRLSIGSIATLGTSDLSRRGRARLAHMGIDP
jgi:hypothetical protein